MDTARSNLEIEFRDSPSLRAMAPALYQDVWRRARRALQHELAAAGPDVEMAFVAAVRVDAPPRYDLDTQILNADWFPAPAVE